MPSGGPTLAESRTASIAPGPAASVTSARAALAGIRVGLVIGACVAVWIAARLAFGFADDADVAPLRTAVRWASEAALLGAGATEGIAMAGPIALVLAIHLAGAAAAGAAFAIAAGTVPVIPRVALTLAILTAEYALWQAAGGHVGPWARAAVWYHLATATLTAVVVLGATADPRAWRGARARPVAFRPARILPRGAARPVDEARVVRGEEARRLRDLREHSATAAFGRPRGGSERRHGSVMPLH
jgi:hypothetical protein